MAIVSLFHPLILLSFAALFPLSSQSVTESEALLKFKNSLTNTEALSSWDSSTKPCEGNIPWTGIICRNGHVLGLKLEKMGLSGTIDIPSLVDLHGLRAISIANNSFSGSIPEFNKFGSLRALYLSGNQFSAEIPDDYFISMNFLKKLWLSNNKFTGSLPLSLANVSNLIELHIENNNFDGRIPPFTQNNLTNINFSNNNLKGEIPNGLSKIGSGFFSGNPGLCGEKLNKSCTQTTSTSPRPYKPIMSKKRFIIAIITLGILLLSLIVFFVLRWINKHKKKRPDCDNSPQQAAGTAAAEVQGTLPVKQEPQLTRKGVGASGQRMAGGPELVMVNDEKGVLGLLELMQAGAEMLGNNEGLVSTFKAVMANGVVVAVKRMKVMNQLGRDDFDEEVKRLGGLRHENVLTPLAYHYRTDEKLLVYEFVPKGSLQNLLHGDRGSSHTELDWPTRLKIIKGIAKGLNYLHTQLSSLTLPHGNLKSSNILLNPDNEPLLTEYGFQPMITSSLLPQSLFAYRSPEALQDGVVSPKSDVYCFGVVILETLTRKIPLQYSNNEQGDGTDVIEYVTVAVGEGRGTELLDPEIGKNINSLGEMEHLLEIGVACTKSGHDQRINLYEAVKRIEEVQVEGIRVMRVVPSLKDGYADADRTMVNSVSLASLQEEDQPSEMTRQQGSPSNLSDDTFSFSTS